MLLRILCQTRTIGSRNCLNSHSLFGFVPTFPILSFVNKNLWTVHSQISAGKRKEVFNLQNALPTLAGSSVLFQNKNYINNCSNLEINQTTILKLPKIYASLSKWYLSLFVAMTMDAGFCLAPVPFNQMTFLLTTIGTMMCSASANTFNQISEVPYDAQMDRTRNRPLVRRLISPLHATTFACITGACGVSMLHYGGNPLTACLGLFNIILYAAVYTPLKRRHWSNTWFGSVVGAIPPLMGWTAATGHLDPGSFILAGILFAWQFPHFYALAWRRKGDYARGAYHMLPLTHPQFTKHVVVFHSLALWALCSAAPATGVTSYYFALMALPLNIWLTNNSIRFQQSGDSKSAQSLYKSSLYYIMLLSIALVFDRKVLSNLKQQSLNLTILRRNWAV